MKPSLTKRRMYLRYTCIAVISALLWSTASYIVAAVWGWGDTLSQIRRIIEENAPTDSWALIAYNAEVAKWLEDAWTLLLEAASEVRKSVWGVKSAVVPSGVVVGTTCANSTYAKVTSASDISPGLSVGTLHVNQLFTTTLNYGYAGWTFGLLGSSWVNITKKNDRDFDITVTGSARKIVLIGSISGGTPPTTGTPPKAIPVRDTCLEVDVLPNSAVANSYTPSLSMTKTSFGLHEGFIVKASGLAPNTSTSTVGKKIPSISAKRNGFTACTPWASTFCYPDNGYLVIDCRPTTATTDATGNLDYYCSQNTSASSLFGNGYTLQGESYSYTDPYDSTSWTYSASNILPFTITATTSTKRTDSCPTSQGLYINPSSASTTLPQCTSCQYIPKAERDLITNCDSVAVNEQDVWSVTRNTTTDTFSPRPPNWPPADCSPTPTPGQSCTKGSACKVPLGSGKYDIYSCFVPTQKVFYRGKLTLDDGTPLAWVKVSVTDRLPMGYGTWCSDTYTTDATGNWNSEWSFMSANCLGTVYADISFDGNVSNAFDKKFFSNPGDQGTAIITRRYGLGQKCIAFGNKNYKINYERELLPRTGLKRDDRNSDNSQSFQAYITNQRTWWEETKWTQSRGATNMAAWAYPEKDFYGNIAECPTVD